MADYLQFKTLTIDGVTVGMVEGLGVTVRDDKTITGFPTSWAWTEGASITLPKGTYIIGASANIPNRTSTGATMVGMAIRTQDGDSWHNKFTVADNQQAVLQSTFVIRVLSNAVTFKAIVASNKAVSGDSVQTTIWAVPIVQIPRT